MRNNDTKKNNKRDSKSKILIINNFMIDSVKLILKKFFANSGNVASPDRKGNVLFIN